MSVTPVDILAHCRRHGLPVPANVLSATRPVASVAAAVPRSFSGAAAMPRHVTGRMTKTESGYAQRLDLQVAAGEVAWWQFEAIKLRLAAPGGTGGRGVWYGVDFLVGRPGGGLWLDEVKGGWVTEDGLLKWRWAAEQYPQLHLRMWQKQRAGDWVCVRQSDAAAERAVTR